MWLTLGWALLIAALTLLPGQPVPTPRWVGSDKVAHAGLFAVLAYGLLSVGYHRRGQLQPRHLLLVWWLTMGYGGLIEWLQLEVPGRSGDLADWLADTIGGLVGATFWLARGRPF